MAALTAPAAPPPGVGELSESEFMNEKAASSHFSLINTFYKKVFPYGYLKKICIRIVLILYFSRHAEFISASLRFNDTLKQVQGD
ncbi:MAG: hypothetical protein J5706_01085, partial [Elusimicrobiales bacterium]|nr:hypothetical protein [Elusimicrobiales bacterium]